VALSSFLTRRIRRGVVAVVDWRDEETQDEPPRLAGRLAQRVTLDNFNLFGA
jgi:hypothetical protein